MVGGDAIAQSSVHNFDQDVQFTFSWTESNRWGANTFDIGDLTINGFAVADPNSQWVEVNDATFTLTIPNEDLLTTGTMLSVLVPTASVSDVGGPIAAGNASVSGRSAAPTGPKVNDFQTFDFPYFTGCFAHWSLDVF